MIGRIAVVLAALVLAGCGQLGVIVAGPVPPASGPAASVLAGLPVKGRAPTTGYRRDQFGQRWRDIDRNGCNQRNDVLARDLGGPVFKPGTGNCLVLSGTLHDPYTDREIGFRRGPATSDDVQIDHVVALSNAWQTGPSSSTVRRGSGWPTIR